MSTKTSKSGISTTIKDNLLLEVKDLTTHFFTQDGVVKAVDEKSSKLQNCQIFTNGKLKG